MTGKAINDAFMRTLFKPEIKTFNNERILSSSSSAAAFCAASVGAPAAKVFIMKPPGHESEKHKLGLIVCIGIVAGNMIEGIALLPANLASIGSISLIGWIIVVIGAMSLAYVYARLSTVNPQSGGPVAYAGEVSTAFGFQSSILYYNANWVGNLAIGVTAVSYLSMFFPALQEPIPAGLACIAIVWIFTILNFMGGSFIGRMATIGLVAMLLPVAGTAIFGWFWFDPQLYMDNWNVSGTTDLDATCRSVLLCLWAFIGIESASVSSGLVDNPRRTVPLATMLGALLAGLVYIGSSQAIAGMFPASVTAASGAPFALSASLMVGDWAAPVVSAITALACLTSLGSWMMLVTQAGARAAQEGYIPKIYGELDKNGLPRKGLILSATQMTVLMAVITAMNASGGSASDLFGMITGIAVLLTMLPYFYSCVNLLRIEGATTRNVISCIASVLGSGFCFIALAGAGFNQLIATFIVSLVIMMFFSWKKGKLQATVKATAAEASDKSEAGKAAVLVGDN